MKRVKLGPHQGRNGEVKRALKGDKIELNLGYFRLEFTKLETDRLHTKVQTKGVEDARERESPTHLEWSHQEQISFDFLHSWTLTRVICIN